jgi:hypothetical protein
MTKQHRSISRVLALFVAVALFHVCLQMSFAAPGTAPAVPQQFIARLTTSGGQPITVNGASAASGATLLTGASIETPAAVSATIDLGALGTVEIQPNSSVQLDFDDNGNVRVKLLRGCAVVKKKGANGLGEIYTPEGASEKTNNNRGTLGFCYLNGGLGPLGQTAAVGGAGGAASKATLIAILAGGGALAGGLIWALSGGGSSNPSRS